MTDGDDDRGRSSGDRADAPPRDVVFVYGQADDGDYGVIRKRDDEIELGRLRAVKEGQPLHGEVVSLKPRPESPRLFDVDLVYDARPEKPRSGPAQVATRSYRDNWDRIFAAPRARDSGALDN
ncbi:MAG: hypothetical protein FJ095_18825 [Deltaproteobacteria bacterium]|nr:hypothetical protein [Deltaproteobacteria bacterium]